MVCAGKTELGCDGHVIDDLLEEFDREGHFAGCGRAEGLDGSEDGHGERGAGIVRGGTARGRLERLARCHRGRRVLAGEPAWALKGVRAERKFTP